MVNFRTEELQLQVEEKQRSNDSSICNVKLDINTSFDWDNNRSSPA